MWKPRNLTVGQALMIRTGVQIIAIATGSMIVDILYKFTKLPDKPVEYLPEHARRRT
jgi:transketolase C-terminal domain/subunit